MKRKRHIALLTINCVLKYQLLSKKFYPEAYTHWFTYCL